VGTPERDRSDAPEFDAQGGSLDLFIDQNIFWLVTPLKSLGANYGFLLDVPFATADAS
jgi:hypothetical protein